MILLRRKSDLLFLSFVNVAIKILHFKIGQTQNKTLPVVPYHTECEQKKKDNKMRDKMTSNFNLFFQMLIFFFAISFGMYKSH